MTVRQLLRKFPYLEKITFCFEDGTTEEIHCDAPGSFHAVRKHHEKEVDRVYAMAASELRIHI